MIFKSGSQTETENLAKALSLFARPGSAIFLKGDLGSGKSTFARSFIKALALGDNDFDVPSPSFSLIQTYDKTRVSVAHIDLYRLRAEAEVDELGLSELAKTHILLIEWPTPAVEAPWRDKLVLGTHC
jgi:N-acetylmuramate 1-kinase